MRLLIVDDSNIIRSRIARAVQDRALVEPIDVVGTARNGIEAVQAARSVRPDAVTMDLTMPEMDGVQCISALLEEQPDLNILVISALDDKSTAITALRQGARGFLPKPFTDDALRLALVELMGNSQT